MKNLKLRKIDHDLTVCKLKSVENFDLSEEFFFLIRTDDEISLVCTTEHTPRNTVRRDDGWKAFRIEGVLDFSLTGILSGILAVLAEHRIAIFALSTYNTDYILVKKEKFQRALDALAEAGYEIL